MLAAVHIFVWLRESIVDVTHFSSWISLCCFVDGFVDGFQLKVLFFPTLLNIFEDLKINYWTK